MLKQFLKRRITAYINETLLTAATDRVTDNVAVLLRRQQLIDAAINSDKPGIKASHDGGRQVIVSLTTHGVRIHEVALAIESVMQGTVLPDSIVLWIDERDTRPLPVTLQRQQRRGLDIRRTHDMGPHTKLIPALRAFPDAIIVTIDDDLFYPHDFLETLLNTHKRHPEAIVANTVMHILTTPDGSTLPMAQWPYVEAEDIQGEGKQTTASAHLFFEGFGGVLYPPASLDAMVFDEDSLSRLCPTADDIWFNAMARKASTPVTLCDRAPFDFIAAVNPLVQANALQTNNYGLGRNDAQLRETWQELGLTI